MSHGLRRGQLTTVIANNSEKTKTLCNNSYISKTRHAVRRKYFGIRAKGKYTPNHLSIKAKYVKHKIIKKRLLSRRINQIFLCVDMEQRLNDNDRGKQKDSKKNLSWRPLRIPLSPNPAL